MAQTIALLTKNPNIDVATPLMNAERYRAQQLGNVRTDLGNQEAALNLGEAQAQTNALRNYRAAAQAGDPNAIKTLAGFPDIQAKVYKALDSMKPPDQNAARDRATAFGDAARVVLGVPDGPAKVAAWNQAIDGLTAKGYLTPDVAMAQKRAGPNELILNEALTGEQLVKQYFASKGKGKTAGAAATSYADLSPADKLKVDEQARKEAVAGVSQYDTLTPEDMATRLDAARKNVIARMFSGANTGTKANVLDLTRRAPAAPTGAPSAPSVYSPTPMARQGTARLTPGDGSTREAPVQFAPGQEQQQFDSLPSGAWFVNPADGRVLIKN